MLTTDFPAAVPACRSPFTALPSPSTLLPQSPTMSYPPEDPDVPYDYNDDFGVGPDSPEEDQLEGEVAYPDGEIIYTVALRFRN